MAKIFVEKAHFAVKTGRNLKKYINKVKFAAGEDIIGE